MTRPTTCDLRTSAVIDFAHTVIVAALNRMLHGRDSRFVLDALIEMVGALRKAEDLGVEMPLPLQCSEDRLFYDGRPLDGPSLQARSLLRRCREREVAVLTFSPGLGVEEANRFFDLLLLPQNVQSLSRTNRDVALSALGIRHVRVSLRSPADPDDRRTDLDHDLDLDRKALHRYQDLADCLQQNHLRAHRDMELAVDDTAHVVERTVAELDEPSMLLSLATQDDVDRFTVGHSVRVALLALQVGRALGASRDQLVQVGAAALMHDIGKSKVPQEVLFKQGRLSADEWNCMAQHPRLGAQLLLEQHETVDARAIGAAFCHHMQPDGRGYPAPILPAPPCGTSRLVRVCDVFEALTSVRPYKRALTPIEAYAVMFRNSRDFDAAWLRQFVRTIGLFPTGSRVQLADGAEAMVVEQTWRPERPIVRLLSGPGGSERPAGRPERLAVGDVVDGVPTRILNICTHDRFVAVPEFDADEPEVLTQTPGHACLSTTMNQDVKHPDGPG